MFKHFVQFHKLKDKKSKLSLRLRFGGLILVIQELNGKKYQCNIVKSHLKSVNVLAIISAFMPRLMGRWVQLVQRYLVLAHKLSSHVFALSLLTLLHDIVCKHSGFSVFLSLFPRYWVTCRGDLLFSYLLIYLFLFIPLSHPVQVQWVL